MKFEDNTDQNSILSDALKNLENAEAINEAAANVQQVLGTEPGSTGDPVTVNDLLAVDELADETVEHAIADELASPCGCVLSIYLASSTSPLLSGNYIGLGTDGVNFFQNSVVIAQTATITGLVLSVRDETIANNFPITGTIFIRSNCTGTPVSTDITAMVTAGQCCAFAPANLVVNPCDLLSVQVVTSDPTPGGVLTDGAAATILYTIP